ncbi:uncharacterized protein LOC130739311 isoform X1 [Lotus japonicus]|uniref:uncharacterized protein LOC130739311 isoform X1 n=1 Tax=Lotus japonicus TaxID=34305 RepID=UPI00258E134F|nr:uncharacterized protein LOC130739311 isoform X1 [Lotus japonicus]
MARKRAGFNKREDDFPSLREYNDYLEQVEDMTFNLIEGVDVAAIEAKIAKYQEENSEQIMVNRARKAEELAAALAASKGQAAQTANDVTLVLFLRDNMHLHLQDSLDQPAWLHSLYHSEGVSCRAMQVMTMKR